jgi:hypothetical protein
MCCDTSCQVGTSSPRQVSTVFRPTRLVAPNRCFQGVKKPYNPVLGEFFRCRYKLSDGSDSFYISEQVSHHPPMSAYYYSNPEHRVSIWGDIRPKSKFLGNSAAVIMQGENHVEFANLPNESYVITMPNTYARGILFGTMMMELGDTASVSCNDNDLICELEFTSKV